MRRQARYHPWPRCRAGSAEPAVAVAAPGVAAAQLGHEPSARAIRRPPDYLRRRARTYAAVRASVARCGGVRPAALALPAELRDAVRPVAATAGWAAAPGLLAAAGSAARND